MNKRLIVLMMIIGMAGSLSTIKASRFAALDLKLTNMGGNDYQVTLVIYRDCSGILPPATVQLPFTCSGNPAFNFILNQVPQLAGTGQEVTPGCYAMPSKCMGGVLYGIREYVYQAMITLPGCDSWTVSWSACCRNPSNTILNATTTSAYIEASINNLHAPGNSSPSFTNKPVTIFFSGHASCYSHGTIDPDGDSLAYHMITPFNNNPNTPIIWIFPYSATQPFPSNPQVSSDPVTGDICMTPTMNILGQMAVKVEQWRTINGTPMMIGISYRDINVNVITFLNHLPTLGGIDTTMVNGYDPNDSLFYMETCPDELVEFTIWGHDNDTSNPALVGYPEKFSLIWNQGIYNATFQPLYQNSDSARAIFTWTPNASQVSNTPKCFNVTIIDQACPYNGSQTFSYCILVKGMMVDLGNDTAVCHGEPVTFTALADNTTLHYYWKLNGIPAGVPLLHPTYTLQTANLAPGIHIVSVETDDGGTTVNCPGKDQVNINVLPLPQPNLGNDTLIGFWETLWLNAGSFIDYQWSTGDTTQFIQIDSTGHGAQYKLIWVQVTDSFGCIGSDTIIIGFVSNPGIEEPKQSGTITVYPNPSDGHFDIILSQFSQKKMVIELYDHHGKLLLTDQITPDSETYYHSINAGNLSNGLYMLILTPEGQPPITQKIIIQ